MFGIEIDNTEVRIRTKGIEALLTNNPEVKERLQALISKEVAKARHDLVDDIKYGLIDSQHESWRSVRKVIYEKVLGANLNILAMRRGTANWKIRQKTRKVEQDPKMRGGNRIKRSFTTARNDGYEGKARGFVLRFVNSGTKGRYAGYGRNGRNKIEYERFVLKIGGRGWRGAIAPTGIFSTNAEKRMNIAAEAIGKMIDAELENYIKSKKE